MNLDILNHIIDTPVKSKTTNSFIGNFINEIKDNTIKKKSFELAKTLPQNTILHFAKFDGNFAICFDNISQKLYYIPRENILGTSPEIGENLKVNSPGKFYVDYTSIPMKETLINDNLNKCEIAK